MKFLICLLSLLLTFSTAWAEELPRCVAIVRIPIPWYAPGFYVKDRMKKSIPEYQAAPGLLFKYFTFGEQDTFGGIYLWKDRASADAWFTPAWIAERSKRYGQEVSVPRYTVLKITNVQKSVPLIEGDLAATLRKYKTAKGESRAEVLARYNSQDPERMKSRGLVRTYLVETGPDSYGEISLWDESASVNTDGEKFRVPLAISNQIN